jgi:hypothetical protein
MILLFFIFMLLFSIGAIAYGFIAKNIFAFVLGAIALIIFASLLYTGVEIPDGVEKSGDQWNNVYRTETPDTDPFLTTVYWFALSLGLFSLGFAILDLFSKITGGGGGVNDWNG